MENKEIKNKRKIAVLLDGPNMLRNEFNFFGIEDIQEAIENYGKIYIKKAYLSHHVTERPKLIEYVFSQGFEPKIGLSDIDTLLTADAIEIIIKRDDINMIAIVSRDSSFLPIFHKAKEYRKESLAVYISSNEGGCNSLKNAADYSIDMKVYIERKKRQNKGDLEKIIK